MSSRSQQLSATRTAKQKAQRLVKREISAWYGDVLAEYRPGMQSVPISIARRLPDLLNRMYVRASEYILGFDTREYKQEEDETEILIRTLIASELTRVFGRRADTSSQNMIDTVAKFMRRTGLSVEPGASPAEYRAVLRNYLTNHTLIIGITEGNFPIEAARRATVLVVNDPLKSSVQNVLDLIEAGDINGAKRLSRRVARLARLPVSVSQGDVIRSVASNPRLYTPLVQAGRIAAVRQDAERLGTGTDEKQWVTSGGPNVRPSHQEANGQKKPVSEPFELAGGIVQHPGDGSLGASLGEIINCQCATVYL